MVVNSMRLDKFISKATELSRKESKKIMHAGEITVNDQVVKDPGLHVDVINDEVMWAGEPLSVATGNRYILLYKPEGFECTLNCRTRTGQLAYRWTSRCRHHRRATHE